MPQLNAFVARSFDPGDERRIQPILDFLDTFKKVGFFCETAEPAEVESVSKKVRRMIDDTDVLIGFFTRRYPIYEPQSGFGPAWKVFIGKVKPRLWTAPAWVLQESGYALCGNKKVILLRETEVEVPGLQGDLEYVPFDANNPAAVFSKLSEMINGLLAEAAGTKVSVVVTQRQEQTQVAMEATVSEIPAVTRNEAGDGPDIGDRYSDMILGGNNHDLDAVEVAWRAGTALIADVEHEGIDQVAWDSFYFESRFTAGATDALEELKRLQDENSGRSEPKQAMGYCYSKSKEFDSAAPFFLAAAEREDGKKKARNLLLAARALQETKRYDEAIGIVKTVLSIVSDSLHDEAISLQYELLKGQGNYYLAFATAETALHKNPQLPVRFSLGLDYRLRDLNEMALYHFKFLFDRNGSDAGSLHNLALLSADCKLPIFAVERYRSAIRLGETLSAVNLGYMCLDCGMAGEAKALITEAMKADNHVPGVEICLSEIIQRREHESERETELLNEAADRKTFFLDMGRALSAPVPLIEGRWKFPFGVMSLNLSSGDLYGSGDVKRQDKVSSLALIGLSGFGLDEQQPKVDTYQLCGKLTGAVCEFELRIAEKKEEAGALAAAAMVLSTPPTKFGFIVFAPDASSATYVELSDSKLGKPEIIRRRKK
jgi:hypothetical protein